MLFYKGLKGSMMLTKIFCSLEEGFLFVQQIQLSTLPKPHWNLHTLFNPAKNSAGTSTKANARNSFLFGHPILGVSIKIDCPFLRSNTVLTNDVPAPSVYNSPVRLKTLKHHSSRSPGLTKIDPIIQHSRFSGKFVTR